MTVPRAPRRLTPAFGFSFVTRSLQECLARQQFGQAEMVKIIEFFDGRVECVFCGSQEVKRWDHLIAVTHGGETVIGNMVPACAPCDDSKQHKPYQEWIIPRGAALGLNSDEIQNRVSRLEGYAAAFGYIPSSLQQRLNADEQATLERIQDDLAGLRIKVEQLIARYRERTGSK